LQEAQELEEIKRKKRIRKKTTISIVKNTDANVMEETISKEKNEIIPDTTINELPTFFEENKDKTEDISKVKEENDINQVQIKEENVN
jgi:hypothetical protein